MGTDHLGGLRMGMIIDNIKVDRREICSEDANGIYLIQDTIEWRDFVNTVLCLF
jgi:hypothetical protein